MERIWGMISVLAVVTVALFFTGFQITGNTTLTSNANYGPINLHKYFYVNCVYLNNNDGWSVMTRGELKYFNRYDGLTVSEEDSCVSSFAVRELDCSDGYMVERKVICPPSMVCKEGICITPII